MNSRLETLIARIEKAQVISSAFEDGELRFQLFHPTSGRLIWFYVPTDTIHVRSPSTDDAGVTGTIALIDLGWRLTTRHDRYLPATETRLLLADAADRVTLAYGRRIQDCRWLLALKGSHPLLCCLVRDLDEIRWIVE